MVISPKNDLFYLENSIEIITFVLNGNLRKSYFGGSAHKGGTDTTWSLQCKKICIAMQQFFLYLHVWTLQAHNKQLYIVYMVLYVIFYWGGTDTTAGVRTLHFGMKCFIEFYMLTCNLLQFFSGLGTTCFNILWHLFCGILLEYLIT